MGNKGGINERQKAFADYYIECGNAAEAARKAGYSANTARQMGKENLTKPYILEYIRQRTVPTEQKRIASGDDVLRFFTRVMDGDEGADMPDRISAGREILKRDVSDRKLEIELLKLESKIGETTQESDIDDTLLEALNGTAMDVWGNSSGEADCQ